MNGQQRFPSEDLCRAVVRMTTLGYPPHIVEGCTGVSEPLAVEIMRRYYASGQPVQPVAVPYPVQQYGYYGYPAVAVPMPYFAPPPAYGYPMGYAPPPVQHPPPVALALPEPTPEPESESEPESEHEPELVEYSTKLSDFHLKFIRRFRGNDCRVDFKLLCEMLLVMKVAISQYQLYRVLRQNNIYVLSPRNLEHCSTERERNNYCFYVGEYKTEQLVFVAQMACNVRFGWSVRGRTKRAQNQKFAICFALSNSGVVFLQILDLAADADTYEMFVENTVIYIQGSPRPESVLILNNRLIKTRNKIVEDARSSGIPCLLLPGGSDDYNPTKQAIAEIKEKIAEAHESLGEAENNTSVEAILHFLVYDLAEDHAERWFRECGYT